MHPIAGSGRVRISRLYNFKGYKGLGYRDFNLKHNQFGARCLRMQQLLATKVQNVHRPMRSYRKLSIRQESNLINDRKNCTGSFRVLSGSIGCADCGVVL